MSPEPTRPLRVPANVPFTIAEPSFATAGGRGSWTLPFVLARDVSPDERLWLHIHAGRNMACRWPGFQVTDVGAEGYISLSTDDGTAIAATGEAIDDSLFVFAPPASGLKKGARVLASLGGQAGAVVPKPSAPERFFVLHAAPSDAELKLPPLYGPALELMVGACHLPILGGEVASIRVYAPSVVRPGEEISLLVRPEDVYRNVAASAPGELAVRLDGREIPARRMPVEGSVCCRLEGVVLPGEGIFRLEIEDVSNGFSYWTDPINCLADGPRIFWGSIHGHTQGSDGTGSLDRYFTYMRDECGVDFGATSDHDKDIETSEEVWRLAQDAVARYNDPGRFTTFLGYEWATWRKRGDGDRNVYYLDDYRPMHRSEDGDCPYPADLFSALRGETALVIPHHPAHIGNHNDWKDHDPEKERLVEIYSYWGCSERSVEEGNILPGSPAPEKKSPNSGMNPLGYVQRALAMGWRVGFVTAADDHSGHSCDQTIRYKNDREYTGGFTAVYAAENTREAIFKALWNRHCYGTTGARIIADFTLSGHPMGSELRLSEHPYLANERRIRVSVNGTTKIRTIEIVRNNVDIHTFTPERPDFEGEWIDTESVADVNLPPAQWSPVPFTFYYIRVTQEDNQQAWLSPIWISE